ncbi:MAG: hypothetical protein H7Y31_15145 [Chitinophagaceae bacterium]|nr:hypothetical protein [Chitinophagaceae bacterium]
MTKKPAYRKLRGYAFDPSLSLKIDTALINDLTYKVLWEENLQPGPSGEYIEVIDIDPTVNKFYSPIDLNHPHILAQDGVDPSTSNPQFHQQMVYAVAMTTIRNFESGLGRPVLWSPRRIKKASGDGFKPFDEYVPTLRIYPHAIRDANAYYSPQKKALLFGYFTARPANVTLQMPDSMTFTCLSHDIIAHETTHAILDGLHRKYTEDTNADVLAFHEAFADIIALFQHFTFPDVLKNQIAATRGDLAAQNQLGKLAQEFGVAIGNYGALRDAIGYYDKETRQWKIKEPTGLEYQTITDPHARGAILVSAIFESFLTIYKKRIADLLRIASGGTGILPAGELHPDLVNRLAAEASKSSRHVLNMCIRALDYCPPVDISFGDFLRALITADMDVVVEDSFDYRLAFIDSFRRRGIYPTGIKQLSAESIAFSTPSTKGLSEIFKVITKFLREYRAEIIYTNNRSEIFDITRKFITGLYDAEKKIYGLHRRLNVKFERSIGFEQLTGLMFSNGWEELGIGTSHAYEGKGPSFFVQSLHLASRVGPDGKQRNQIILCLVQEAKIIVEKKDGHTNIIAGKSGKSVTITGGCTLIFDLDTLDLKYAISKPLLDVAALSKGIHRLDERRAIQQYNHQHGFNARDNPFRAYFSTGAENAFNEPFCFLHTH